VDSPNFCLLQALVFKSVFYLRTFSVSIVYIEYRFSTIFCFSFRGGHRDDSLSGYTDVQIVTSNTINIVRLTQVVCSEQLNRIQNVVEDVPF